MSETERSPIPDVAASFVRCRSSWQGHDWDDAPAPPTARPAPQGWAVATFRCARCGMTKSYVVNSRTGETEKPRYRDRPVGYKAPGTTTADWRALFARQFLNGTKR